MFEIEEKFLSLLCWHNVDDLFLNVLKMTKKEVMKNNILGLHLIVEDWRLEAKLKDGFLQLRENW